VTTTLSAGPAKVTAPAVLTLQRPGLADLSDAASVSYTGPSLAQGTGAGQVTFKYAARLTIAASGSTTLTLSSLLDAFGNAIAFLKVKEMLIVLTGVTGSTGLAVGGATNPFVNWISTGTATVLLRTATALFLGDCSDATGYAVVASTGDQLKITNSDSANVATVDVQILGA
jgi:hypothetical protein